MPAMYLIRKGEQPKKICRIHGKVGVCPKCRASKALIQALKRDAEAYFAERKTA